MYATKDGQVMYEVKEESSIQRWFQARKLGVKQFLSGSHDVLPQNSDKHGKSDLSKDQLQLVLDTDAIFAHMYTSKTNKARPKEQLTSIDARRKALLDMTHVQDDFTALIGPLSLKTDDFNPPLPLAEKNTATQEQVKKKVLDHPDILLLKEMFQKNFLLQRVLLDPEVLTAILNQQETQQATINSAFKLLQTNIRGAFLEPPKRTTDEPFASFKKETLQYIKKEIAKLSAEQLRLFPKKFPETSFLQPEDSASIQNEVQLQQLELIRKEVVDSWPDSLRSITQRQSSESVNQFADRMIGSVQEKLSSPASPAPSTGQLTRLQEAFGQIQPLHRAADTQTSLVELQKTLLEKKKSSLSKPLSELCTSLGGVTLPLPSAGGTEEDFLQNVQKAIEDKLQDYSWQQLAEAKEKIPPNHPLSSALSWSIPAQLDEWKKAEEEVKELQKKLAPELQEGAIPPFPSRLETDTLQQFRKKVQTALENHITSLTTTEGDQGAVCVKRIRFLESCPSPLSNSFINAAKQEIDTVCTNIQTYLSSLNHLTIGLNLPTKVELSSPLTKDIEEKLKLFIESATLEQFTSVHMLPSTGLVSGDLETTRKEKEKTLINLDTLDKLLTPLGITSLHDDFLKAKALIGEVKFRTEKAIQAIQPSSLTRQQIVALQSAYKAISESNNPPPKITAAIEEQTTQWTEMENFVSQLEALSIPSLKKEGFPDSSSQPLSEFSNNLLAHVRMNLDAMPTPELEQLLLLLKSGPKALRELSDEVTEQITKNKLTDRFGEQKAYTTFVDLPTATIRESSTNYRGRVSKFFQDKITSSDDQALLEMRKAVNNLSENFLVKEALVLEKIDAALAARKATFLSDEIHPAIDSLGLTFSPPLESWSYEELRGKLLPDVISRKMLEKEKTACTLKTDFAEYLNTKVREVKPSYDEVVDVRKITPLSIPEQLSDDKQYTIEQLRQQVTEQIIKQATDSQNPKFIAFLRHDLTSLTSRPQILGFLGAPPKTFAQSILTQLNTPSLTTVEQKSQREINTIKSLLKSIDTTHNPLPSDTIDIGEKETLQQYRVRAKKLIDDQIPQLTLRQLKELKIALMTADPNQTTQALLEKSGTLANQEEKMSNLSVQIFDLKMEPLLAKLPEIALTDTLDTAQTNVTKFIKDRIMALPPEKRTTVLNNLMASHATISIIPQNLPKPPRKGIKRTISTT